MLNLRPTSSRLSKSGSGFLKQPAFRFLTLFSITALLFSCAAMIEMQEPDGDRVGELNKSIEELAFEISNRVREFSIADKTVAVTTFVDLDNLEKTSSFGRYVAEQLSSELFKLGFHVRELRQSIDIDIIRKKGELVLSRRSENLMKNFPPDSVIAGTYTIVGDKVVLNVRLLSLDTSRLVSVGRIITNLRLNQFLARLLRRGVDDPPTTVKVYTTSDGGS